MEKKEITSYFYNCTKEGYPAGGSAYKSHYLSINYQNGPITCADDVNGASVEDVIECGIDRLEFFQTACNGKFANEYNAKAIECLREAIKHLEARTKEREARKVEGTYKV